MVSSRNILAASPPPRPTAFTLASGVDLKQLSTGSRVSVTQGMWVSEAALWVDWVNHGRLVADTHCFLVEVGADELAEALREITEVLAIAIIYARRFYQALVGTTE